MRLFSMELEERSGKSFSLSEETVRMNEYILVVQEDQGEYLLYAFFGFLFKNDLPPPKDT